MHEPTGQRETRGAAEAASLAVVLVDHNGLPDTRDCLGSLARDDIGRLWAAGGGHVAWRAFSYNRGQDERDDGRWDAPGEMTFLSACAFLARLSAFERGGMFDPDFFLYGEDAELCARWQRAGLRLFYVPAARVLHRGSVAAGDEYAPLQAYLRYRNRL